MSGPGGGSRLTPTEKEIARKLPLLDEARTDNKRAATAYSIDPHGAARAELDRAEAKAVSAKEVTGERDDRQARDEITRDQRQRGERDRGGGMSR